jgi:hypothetical protein
MVTYQVLREALIQWIGVLGACTASIGIRVSNNQMHGQTINKYRCFKFFKDEMVISRFYLYETLIHHNFVVFRTECGHTFRVHLVADVHSGQDSSISIEISPTEWRPIGKYVGTCNKRALDLKRFVKYEIRKFGTYELGFNDCRHFARAVAAFLAS